jgi:hypothetical protein
VQKLNLHTNANLVNISRQSKIVDNENETGLLMKKEKNIIYIRVN